MDAFEINKIAGALLATVLMVMGLHMLAGALFYSPLPDQPGLVVEVAGADGEAAAPAEEAEPEIPFAVLLADADPAKGESSARKCVACHTFEQGGANKVGPPMWDVVNRVKGAVDGFNYSDAMETVGTEGQVWGFDELNKFLEDPKGYLKGTTMGFAGIRKPAERADIVAYLRTLSPSPAPLPEPPAEESADEAAAPEETQAAPESEPASDSGADATAN